MRLSSVQIFQQGISGILDHQIKLNRTEQQLATGLKMLSPSDDPVAAVQILDITEDLASIDQFQRNSNLAEGQLAQEETVLTDVGNLLQRVRDLVVQANNATQSPETRRSIATEIEGKLDQLQSLANTRDSSGEYIFAGFQTQIEPFSRQGDQIVYQGDDNQRFLQLSSNSQVAVRDSGFDVFQSIPSGNGVFVVKPDAANTGTAVVSSSSATGAFVRDNYSISFSQATSSDPISYQVLDSGAGVVASGNYEAGDTISFPGANVSFGSLPQDGDSFAIDPAVKQDMFSTLQGIIDELQGVGSAPAEVASFNNAMGFALGDIDHALDNLLSVRADVGVRLSSVENQLNINESFKLQLQQTLSGIQDLDYAEAISRFNVELTALQAAQQTFVKMQGLSLFNLL